MKKRLILVLVACLWLLTAAACGGGDAASKDPSAPKGTAASAEGTAGSAAQSTAAEGADPSGSAASEGTGRTVANTGKTNAKTNPGKTQGKTNGPAASAATTTGKAGNSLRGTTVQYATWEDISKMEYGPVVERFTKQTGIRVRIVTVPQTDYATKLAARISAQSSPDVIKDNGEFPRLLSLMDSVTKMGIDPTESRWDQNAVKQFTVKGKPYGVTSRQTIFQARYLVYYNKSLFAENGIVTPEAYVKANKWTWDALKKAAQEVAAVQGVDYGCGFNVGPFLSSYKADYFAYDGTKFINQIGSPAVTDGWRFLLEGRKEGYFYLEEGRRSLFVEGKAGMWITDTFGLKTNGYWKAMKTADIGYTYLPKKTEADASYPAGGWPVVYSLAKGAKNPAGAGEFLKFYLNQDNYDLDLTYKSAACRQFADELAAVTIPLSSYHVGYSMKSIAGASNNMYTQMYNTDPAQLQSKLNSLKNVISKTVSSANHMLTQAE